MEDEIKVGDYVRDSDGCIFKVNEIVPDDDTDDLWLEEGFLKGTWKSMVKKYSSNIIDLIEEGDYVNGQEVIEIRKQNNKIYLMTDYMPPKYIKEDIKSIATHEQIKSIEYKI